LGSCQIFKRVQLAIIGLKNWITVYRQRPVMFEWLSTPQKRGGGARPIADRFENSGSIIHAGYNLLYDAIENTFLAVGA